MEYRGKKVRDKEEREMAEKRKNRTKGRCRELKLRHDQTRGRAKEERISKQKGKLEDTGGGGVEGEPRQAMGRKIRTNRKIMTLIVVSGRDDDLEDSDVRSCFSQFWTKGIIH